MSRVTDLLERVGQRFVGARSSGGDAAEEDPALDDRTVREDWSFSKALVVDISGDAVLEQVAESKPSPDELPRETGFTPGEYLEYAVAAADGRLTERALVNHTGWPPPVLTDLLVTLEEHGRLAIESHGRITLVCLPNHTTRAPRNR